MIVALRPFMAAVLAVALAGCATGEGTEAPRVVSESDLSLGPPDGSGDRSFGARSVQGRIGATGNWTLSAEVPHRALRCATYETGIQVGRGQGGCTGVGWLSAPEYVTRLIQCNGATRIHSGQGTIALPAPGLESVNCVRVLVRCAGPC
jgi:hypothetical protein